MLPPDSVMFILGMLVGLAIVLMVVRR